MPVNGATPLACVMVTERESCVGDTTQASALLHSPASAYDSKMSCGDKPEATLRLYSGGNVKARLDVAHPRSHIMVQLGLTVARGGEPSFASALPPT